MSDFPICPPGYNSDPVVLTHIAVNDNPHPNHPKLRVAMCAPVWFSPIDYEITRNVIRCPSCFRLILTNDL